MAKIISFESLIEDLYTDFHGIPVIELVMKHLDKWKFMVLEIQKKMMKRIVFLRAARMGLYYTYIFGKKEVEMKCFGEFEYEISNGIVYLPDKFQLADKDMTILVMEDEGITFIRIYDVLIDELGEAREQSSVILLEKKQIHSNKDGSFLMPEIFRQRMTMSKDTSVVVRGLGSAVEILSKSDRDEEEEKMDAWITAF